MIQSITILYVEDEDKLRYLVKSYFDRIFKNIILAKDGQEGLELFNKNQDQIDIVVSDINMPKLNGLDMIQSIKEKDPDIPIIITSAYNDTDNLHKAITLGVKDFVHKPVDLKKLLDTIKKALEPLVLKEQIEKEMIKNAKALGSEKLAAGLTHELNTPLTYIKANFEMISVDLEDIEDCVAKQNIEQSVSKISSGIKRIETIINSIKEISLSNNETYEDTNVFSTIISALGMTYNKTKHITQIFINNELFDLDMNKTNEKYNFISYAQKHRLEQLWIIIILNSIDELVKVEEFEHRQLNITTLQDGENIKIIFEDNAGGIDKNIIENIFEPFKGTKSSSGLGVGLSIAKKIIDDQDGASIQAYNQNNNAIFEITLKKLKKEHK